MQTQGPCTHRGSKRTLLSPYLHIYIHIHARLHISTDKHLALNKIQNLYVYMHIHTKEFHAYVYIRMYICIYTQVGHALHEKAVAQHPFAYAHICIHTLYTYTPMIRSGMHCTNTYIHTHLYIHIYTCTYIHTHMYMCIHAGRSCVARKGSRIPGSHATPICVCTHIYIHTLIYTYTH